MIDYNILAQVRKEKGITWGYLESVIGGYRGKFTDYKKGKTTLSEQEEYQISKALNVALAYLEGKTDIKEQKNKPTDNNVSEPSPELYDALRILNSFPDELRQQEIARLKVLYDAINSNKKD